MASPKKQAINPRIIPQQSQTVPEPKAVNIRIELDNSTILEATGSHAEEIWAWWMFSESVACDDGFQYVGNPINPKPK